MGPSPDQAATSSALWARSLAANAAALVLCRYLLTGFEIPGVSGYLLAVVGLEVPTIAWLLLVQVSLARPDWGAALRRFPRPYWLSLGFALLIWIPLFLSTSAPGLIFTAWISPLRIAHVSTFILACLVIAGLKIVSGQSLPLRFVVKFVRSFGSEEARRKSEESSREFREALRDFGRILRDSLLQVWLPHRSAIRFTQAVLGIVAIVAGGLAFGEWFGAVLGLAVVLLPAAILRLLVRSKREELRSRANS